MHGRWRVSPRPGRGVRLILTSEALDLLITSSVRSGTKRRAMRPQDRLVSGSMNDPVAEIVPDSPPTHKSLKINGLHLSFDD